MIVIKACLPSFSLSLLLPSFSFFKAFLLFYPVDVVVVVVWPSEFRTPCACSFFSFLFFWNVLDSKKNYGFGSFFAFVSLGVLLLFVLLYDGHFGFFFLPSFDPFWISNGINAF